MTETNIAGDRFFGSSVNTYDSRSGAPLTRPTTTSGMNDSAISGMPIATASSSVTIGFHQRNAGPRSIW